MQSEENRLAALEARVAVLEAREVERDDEHASLSSYVDAAVRALSDRLTALERRAAARDEDEQLYRGAADARFVTPERLAETIRFVFFAKEKT